MLKKTVIFGENTEPPKNYIWITSDGDIKIFNGRKWVSVGIIERIEEVERKIKDIEENGSVDSLSKSDYNDDEYVIAMSLNDLNSRLDVLNNTVDDLQYSINKIYSFINNIDLSQFYTKDESDNRFVLRSDLPS